MNDSASATPEIGRIGIGVIGANSFVANAAVLPAIDTSNGASLTAVASRSAPVPERWAHLDVGDYDAVIDSPAVDAVYVPLPNGLHRTWTRRAAAAGKHVLCEKPLAPDPRTATDMAEACARAGVLLAEAYMTPFHPRYAHLLDTIGDGAIGDVTNIDARFTFTIGPEASDNYRWDPTQGGGALLDVGIYTLGPVVQLLGAHPERIVGGTTLAPTGVDASTHATLTYTDGPGGHRRHASIHCSFVDDEQQHLVITGTSGRLRIDHEAFTGGDDAHDPYLHMIETFADAVSGRAEWPRPAERSIEMLELIERIREATT